MGDAAQASLTQLTADPFIGSVEDLSGKGLFLLTQKGMRELDSAGLVINCRWAVA